MRHLAFIPFVLLAACGDDGGSQPPIDSRLVDSRVVDAPNLDAPPDGPPPIDAMATVQAVTCPNGQLPTVTAPDGTGAFDPASQTIAVGDIVKVTMQTQHSVIPHATLPTDPGLRATFNTSTCLQFTVAGTFNFQCFPHGFVGSVIVQ